MFKKYITDILKDKDHPKFSLTRFAAIGTIILFWVQAGTATYTMYKTQTTDHVLIGEVIGVILTLLGFKTGLDFLQMDKRVIYTMIQVEMLIILLPILHKRNKYYKRFDIGFICR